MKYLFAYHTDKGGVKSVNQDSLLVEQAVYRGQEVVLAVICDGMGGLKHGELASAGVIWAFDEWFRNIFPELADQDEFEDELYDSWEILLQDMHRKIKEYGKGHGIRIGTTATVMLLWQREYYIAHIGDCRIYEIKDGIRRLTKDQVQAEIERDGKENVLLQGIGASKRICPVYYSGKVEEEAVFLLCTDGFRHKISEQELYQFFAPEEMNDERVMRKQAKRITETIMERGERDNISVLVLRTTPGEGGKEVTADEGEKDFVMNRVVISVYSEDHIKQVL